MRIHTFCPNASERFGIGNGVAAAKAMKKKKKKKLLLAKMYANDSELFCMCVVRPASTMRTAMKRKC